MSAGPAVASGADVVTVRELAGRVLLSEPLEFRVPEFGLADMETVDVLLVTNCRTMLALPYLTERTGFKVGGEGRGRARRGGAGRERGGSRGGYPRQM